MKMQPLKYSLSVTFGRFNIPHLGHVQLIRKMLSRGEHANVYVSAGKLNNEWDLRVLALRTSCRKEKIDLSRVTFLKANSPYSAINETTEIVPPEDVALVLGSDQREMGCKLSTIYDVSFVENERTNSSTNMRFFLDREENQDDLTKLYKGNLYAVKLAKRLRQEELNRERLSKTAAKVA